MENINSGDKQCDIYGVNICDPDLKITPEMARDAIVRCFIIAHGEQLDDLKNYGDVSEEEFKKIKHMEVEILIKNIFKETGGDFNIPTKESIMNMLNKLAEYAKNFRNQAIVEKHYSEIMLLVDKIKI